MPTYQSAPNYPVVFPDAVAHENPYGFRTMKGNTILIRGEIDPGHSAHPLWKNQADEVALARVHNTFLAKQKMMKQPASMKGLHSYTTQRGDFNSVRGGTVWSKKGEEMIQGLVRDRKFQYDALNEATFDSIPQNRLQVNLPPSETYKLDKLFLDTLSNITTGNVKPLYTELGSLISELMMSADKISENKVDEYLQYISQINDALTILQTENYGLVDSKYLKDVASMNRRVIRVQAFLQKLAEFRGRPTKEKMAAIQTMKYSLLADSQPMLQRGALGLYPGVEEAYLNRTIAESGNYGPATARVRREARDEEIARVRELQTRLGRPADFSREEFEAVD